MKTAVLIASGIILAAFATAPAPAEAKTKKECSAQWKEMKEKDQTAGMKYAEFSKQCMAEGAAPAPEAKPAPMPPPPAAEKAAPPPPMKPAAATPPAAAPVVTGKIVFPPAVSSKYSTDTAGKARMLTCRDQYETNKPGGANGGLKWI